MTSSAQSYPDQTIGDVVSDLSLTVSPVPSRSASEITYAVIACAVAIMLIATTF